MKREALLVTPLPPAETGLALFASRLLRITRNTIDWTVAYTEGSEPHPEHRCLPVSELGGTRLPEARVFQLGNSPHCSQIIPALRKWGGGGILHEVNFHHLLRHMADSSGEWTEYEDHVRHQYGSEAGRVLKIMNRRARSRSEYDMRLRRYPLIGRILEWCGPLACLNRYAGNILEKSSGKRPVMVIGHPLDPVPSPLPLIEEPPPGALVLGMAGGFGYGRGWEHGIKVAGEVRRTRECMLVAAGAGWPDPGLSWVRVTGRLPEPGYQATLRTFHIGLDLRTGSCGETSGSLLEILRAGIPSIVTDSGSFRCIPSDAVLRVSSAGLPDSAAAAAEFLLADPTLMRSLGERGRTYAETQGDQGEFEALIHRLLDGSRRSSL